MNTIVEASPHPPQEAGQEPNPVSTASLETLEEILERNLQSAVERFAIHDLFAAFEVLEKIPESQRTPTLKDLHGRFVKVKCFRSILTSAEKIFAERNFTQAIAALETIPRSSRTGEINRLLERARALVNRERAADQARDFLAMNDFDEAVHILDKIPKGDRSEELLALYEEARGKQQQIQALRDQIEAKLAQAGDNPTDGLFDEALALVDEVLSLRPGDKESRRQQRQIYKLKELLELRDRLFATALEHFEEQDYAGTLELIKQVPETMCQGDVAELAVAAEESLREIKRLTSEIIEMIRQEQFDEIHEKLQQLLERRSQAADIIIRDLGSKDFETFLVALGGRSGDDSSFLLLEDFIRAMSPVRLVQFLESASGEFQENYPAAGVALPGKLGDILDGLHKEPERAAHRWQAVKTARAHLGDHQPQFDAWGECFEAMDEFVEHAEHRWRWEEALIENQKSRRLESAAHRLAEAAGATLPDECDRWPLLQRIAKGRLDGTEKVPGRASTKIADFLETSQWSPTPLTPITFYRVIVVAITVAGLAIFGSIAQLLISLLFDVGGYAGYFLVAFLLAVWTTFCIAANKIL